MKRFITLVSACLVVSCGIIPVANASSSISFSGSGEARALDLAIPALQRLIPAGTPSSSADAIKDFKGLTLGLTSSKFSTAPLSASGSAMGLCDLLGDSGGSAQLPDPSRFCSTSTTKTSDTARSQAGDATMTCKATPVAVIQIDSACARSFSSVASGISSTNEAGVSDIKITLDLTSLGAEELKDSVVDALQGFVTDFLLNIVHVDDPTVTQKQSDLKSALSSYLNQIKDGGQAASIKAGASKTLVTTTGSITTVTSESAAAAIGFLGVSNALTDGLIIINSSSGSATATVDKVSGVASASAVPVIVTLKVKDLLDLDKTSDYLTVANVKKEDLDPLLTQLNTLQVLQTSITVGEPKVVNSPDHRAAAASVSGVEIHALKGLGESSAGAKDGGFDLRLAAEKVEAASTEVSNLTLASQTPTPHTGGPVYVLIAVGALTVSMSVLLLRFARKIVAVR